MFRLFWKKEAKPKILFTEESVLILFKEPTTINGNLVCY
jgi:hypothetical protein